MGELTTPDGRRLAWRETGSGPLLVCHPGGPGASGAYFGGLPELAAECTLLILDPRGTGASDRPADPSAYDLEDYAADLETLREHLGLERLDLLGHSHGGFVAQAWAGAHPERVGRLVLANTAARFGDAIRDARARIALMHAQEPWFADAMAALHAHQAGDYADDEELWALLEREGRLLFPRWGADEERIVALLSEARMNADVLRHFNATVAPAMDLRAGLAAVTSPVLVLTGEEDPFGESTAREIADALPDATTVVTPGGHFAFAEAAGRGPWCAAVLTFLGHSS